MDANREPDLAYLWLYGDVTTSHKIQKFLILQYGSALAAWEQSARELQRILSVKFQQEEFETLLLSKNRTRMEKTYERLLERGIFLLYPGHNLYPEKLLHIYDRPELLYARGHVPKTLNYHNQTIAIVGARNADCYCRETTRIFARELAERGIQIVSGLARGIDAQAHIGTLEADGYTVAVLGCGINVTYPPENAGLFAQVERHGLILSEYGLDIPPAPLQFPLRNRIISGLSDGVFVTCARKKSGSLITADHALDQGKQVYALPGRALDPCSEGTNQLIRMGAICVTRPQDILIDLWGEERLACGEENSDFDKLFRGEEKLNLAPAEKIVYSLLGLDPVHIDDVIAKAKLGVTPVISILYGLEQRKLIRQTARGYYIRVL